MATTLEAHHYAVEVLTEYYMFAASLEPFGMLMTYLNHPERKTFQFKNVTATALYPGSTIDSFQAEELWLVKDEILAIRFITEVTTGTMPLMPRKEKLRVFIPRFVVQATFYCGADTVVGEIFESTASPWAPTTEASVFSLLPSQHPVFRDAKQLLINKRRIRFYQPIKS